jgi:2-deoxy-D-gluconate 3-dehydrogenase
VVRRLAEAGANVCVLEQDATAADTARRALDAAGLQSRWYVGDVRDEERVRVVCQEVGRSKLDILVNNAGLYPHEPLMDLTASTWRTTFGVNVDGVLHCTHTAAELMMAHGAGGAVVTVGSVAGVRVVPGLAHYSAAKAAAMSLTESFALELAPHGIRANAVAPGGIATPGYGAAARQAGATPTELPIASRPLGRFGTPDDVACAVLYLASDMARYVTGATLVVDGGRLLL